MKFPYGIADFYKLITAGYYYADRTGYIPIIEDAGEQLLFLRPRRFGKSLLLSMLENYYDLQKAGEFDRLFGHLIIGRNPTPKRNQYFVLKWDFSAVDPSGTVQQALKRSIKPATSSRYAISLSSGYFKVFDNRDYLQANELAVKTAFLTLLFNDLL